MHSPDTEQKKISASDTGQHITVMEQGGVVIVEKIRVKAATIAVVFALVANVLGFTWGVFQYHQGIEDQRESLTELSDVIADRLVPAIQQLEESTRRIERRVDLIEERERMRFPSANSPRIAQ